MTHTFPRTPVPESQLRFHKTDCGMQVMPNRASSRLAGILNRPLALLMAALLAAASLAGTVEPEPPPTITDEGEVAVPVDWSLKPSGLDVGDRFRLLFLSSTKRDASSTSISVYNGFVQDLAEAGHADVRSYASHFRAVACTSAVDARDNKGTTGTGVPIRWLGGAKAADDNADFYDGFWDEEATVRDESGSAVTIRANSNDGRTWTGCTNDGTEAFETEGTVSRAMGTSSVRFGMLNWPNSDVLHPLDWSSGDDPKATSHRLYALSPVFVVMPPSRAVPVDWSLKPSVLETGDRFRLLFLSSTKRDASSTRSRSDPDAADSRRSSGSMGPGLRFGRQTSPPEANRPTRASPQESRSHRRSPIRRCGLLSLMILLARISQP